jgi:two-component system NtrC family sensor kinase
VSAPARAGGLALVGAVARLLNAGLGPERTLVAAAEALREGLGARRVAFWIREPRSGRLRAFAAPPDVPAPTPSALDELPPPGPDTMRHPLSHEDDRFGLLEADVAFTEEASEVLGIVADVLAPFLASLEVSEDLAHEVALQSREIDVHRRFTSHIIDCLPVGLYVVDRQYRIQVWNRKRETGTQGLRRDEVVGRRVFDVLTRQSAEQLRSELDEVFEAGRTLRSEVEVNAGGERRHYRITKLPMRLDDATVTHVITIGEDVTEWRHIQMRILQSEKLAAIGQLAAGIMHEINNPLATISACAAALEGRVGEPGPAAAASMFEYLEMIEKEVQRCTRIIDGLLDFSRPKGKQKAPVSLGALAEDALFLLRHHERYRQVVVATDLAAAPPALGNAEQLVQVLLALMLNALDALEAGGQITVRTRSGRGGREAVLEVEDTGAGIPREEQSKIFEPFYTTKAPGRGTGLGLSICYGIVQEHRGRIEVDSQPGRGSTFRVILPAVEE